jgi:hypothetical protein
MRYNDGEYNSMFKLLPPSATTSGECHHFRDLSDAVFQAFTDTVAIATKSPHAKILLGACWLTDTCYPGSKIFGQFLEERGLLHSVRWGAGDIWYNTAGEGAGTVIEAELWALFDAIRARRNVVLVGNESIAAARHCLGAQFVQIAKPDAWLHQDILVALRRHAAHGSTFVWCAGLPAKPWSCRLWDKYPSTSHIDFGHFFDGVFGVRNRMWLKRGYGPHWDFLQKKLIPYVKQAIPKR